MHLAIGLPAWTIQDGNYPNFVAGSVVQFALEYRVYDSVTPSSNDKVEINYIGKNQWEVTGRKVPQRRDDDYFKIIDIGILAYSERGDNESIDNLAPDEFFFSRIYLGVDSGAYMESARGNSGVIPLVYTWQIERISIQTAPLVEVVDATGLRHRERDYSQSRYRDIDATDAWRDDGGNGAYILHCEKLDISPMTPDEVFP